jgi:GDP-L-fucose synthase
MDKSSKILVTGSGGMLGSSVLKKLKNDGYSNILYPRKKELNLVNSDSVDKYFEENKPEYVFLIAAKVGGIYANMTYRADFIYENLMIESNVINSCKSHSVKKIVFVSSGCVYPKNANNPIIEDDILTGKLEPSNEHYSIAKIAGIKMCEAYYSQYKLRYSVVIPNNIYGPGDNYHPENSHVMASLIRKFHNAKIKGEQSVEIWGSGNQIREFIYVDDVSDACIDLLSSDSIGSFNCSSEVEISIKNLAYMISDIVGYNGEIFFNTEKPEGHFRKGFSCEKLRQTGWFSKTKLIDGINKSYEWYKKNLSNTNFE